MRFYTQTHKHYCGIDLHARSMYLCILDTHGEILLHHNFKAEPEALLKAVAPYCEDLVVAVECTTAAFLQIPQMATFLPSGNYPITPSNTASVWMTRQSR